jgi:hypothetical protein
MRDGGGVDRRSTQHVWLRNPAFAMLSLRFSFDWQPFLEAMLFNGMLIKRHG